MVLCAALYMAKWLLKRFERHFSMFFFVFDTTALTLTSHIHIGAHSSKFVALSVQPYSRINFLNLKNKNTSTESSLKLWFAKLVFVLVFLGSFRRPIFVDPQKTKLKKLTLKKCHISTNLIPQNPVHQIASFVLRRKTFDIGQTDCSWSFISQK